MKWSVVFFIGAVCIFSQAVADWIQPPETVSGYLVPQPNVEPQYPRDLGLHPGYAIEWWYWVGHLQSVDGSREFGFQSTVFRLEGDSKKIRLKQHLSPFGTQQLFMAHVALSDLSTGCYLHEERVLREGWQAQSSTQTLDLEVGPIIARWDAKEALIKKTLALPEERLLEVRLRPLKPLIAFGEQGLSRKGADPAAVSWYWTYPRLEISGVLVEGNQRTEVSGIGWMDHEISSSQLGSDLDGWDWTAIQLDDGTEVKAYRLRTEKGGADPWSAVYWIDSQGKTSHVYAKDFEWETNKVWKSDKTGNRYPTEVTIRAMHPVIGEEKTYRLRPLLSEQEFIGNSPDDAYWEGACSVFDESDSQIGRAYLELFGYAGEVSSQLIR